MTSLHISATVRLRYLENLLRQSISTLDMLPPGQTTAIITITANMLQVGISERFSSLIQAVTVMIVALIIGCIACFELMLATATGLVLIAVWYMFMTPRIASVHMDVQTSERDAAGAASETFACIRMIAAYGAEGKMMRKHSELVQRVQNTSRRLSPVLALQHSPGTLVRLK